MHMPSLEEFKKKAMEDMAFADEYEKLKPVYQLKKELIKARKKAGLTQEQIARKLHTSKSNISRLESFSYNASPRITTFLEYAAAAGYEIEFTLREKRA